MAKSGFKMKGWSWYQNSPMPQDKTLSEEQKKTIATTKRQRLQCRNL